MNVATPQRPTVRPVVQEGNVHVRIEVRSGDTTLVYEREEPLAQRVKSPMHVAALRAMGLLADQLVRETV